MASSYTGLGTELMATGEEAGTWGSNTNTNLKILEQIAGGYIEVDLAGAEQTTTLAVSDGAVGAALAHRCITWIGTITGNQTVTIPLDVETFYIIRNSVSGSFSVNFKYVSGTGGSVTWASGDSGTKIVYAGGVGDDATNPAIVDATSAFVTATSTTTLTNKTLTAPKFADGGFIADANGAEALVFGTTSSALNEVKITNAATGTAGPIIASQGQTNSNLQLRPAGSGKITVGSAAANATVSSNGAYDLILETNEGTSSGKITITDASNGNIALAPEGTGEVVVGSGSAAGDITSSGAYDLIIDTNSGTNAGNITLTDGADGDIDFTTNGAGFVKFNDAAYNPEATLSDGATVSWDAQAEPVSKVTLAGNRTLALPTNPIAGAFISLLIIQDGTGSRTVTWNAAFEFPSDTAPTLTTTADLADLFVFRYHNTKWLQVGSTLALTVS
jgi:hypothetical protein